MLARACAQLQARFVDHPQTTTKNTPRAARSEGNQTRADTGIQGTGSRQQLLEDGPFYNAALPSLFLFQALYSWAGLEEQMGPRYCVFAVQIKKSPIFLKQACHLLRSWGGRWRSVAASRQAEAGSGTGVLRGGRREVDL